MKWKDVLLVLLITLCVQTVFIQAQGFLDPFGLRKRNRDKVNENHEEERETSESVEDTPVPHRRLPGLDFLKPPDIFGLGRDRDRGKHNERRGGQGSDGKYTVEETGESEFPMPRSLDGGKRNGEKNTGRKDEENSEEHAQKQEFGPCGPNNEYCNGENYIKELGLKWSRRVHNGTGIYLRDKMAPGGKRFVLVGIDMPNEKYGFCTTPDDQRGYCRHLEHCVLDDFRNNFIIFLEYLCDIPNQNYVGTCCPRSNKKKESEPEARAPEASMPDGRDLPPRFPPFNLQPPFFQRTTTTTSAPRRRTTNRSRAGNPQGRSSKTCGQADIIIPRIVGGRRANPKAWPWMAALLKKSEATDHRAGQYCGGVLIGEFHVMTAAHCVEGIDVKDLSVRIGEYDFSRKNDTSEDIDIAEVLVHENFNRYTYQNDIAILRLSKSAYYDPRIKSICLPDPDDAENALVNEVAIVTGFGTIYYGGPTSDILMEISVPIWRQEDCQAAYTQPIEETNLCAGVRSGSRDSCQGDSGGPLQLQLHGRWTVVGVVSWGIRCSEPGFPGVYTRVTKYINWIANRMRNR